MTRTWLRVAGMAVLLAGLAVLSWQAAGGAADDKPGAETLPPDLARVPGKALAMFSVRVADLWSSALAKGIRNQGGKGLEEEIQEDVKKTGLDPGGIERITGVLVKWPPVKPLLFFTTTKAFDRSKVFTLLVPDGKEEKYNGGTIIANKTEAGYILSDRTFVAGPKGDIQSLIDTGKTKQEGGLAPVIALAAKKHSVAAGLNLAALPPLGDDLPDELEPFKPLLKASNATLTVDLSDKISGKFRIAFAGGDDAGAGLKAVETGRKLALGFLGQGIEALGKEKEMKAMARILQVVRKDLSSARLKRDGNAVVGQMDLNVELPALGAELAVATQKVREAATRAQSQNNLKQIALAMYNYHDTNGRFPAQAIYDKDGKALLSWRVMILPYLDQEELYKQFHLDEAWDSPHNKKLLAKIPKTYQAPAGMPKHPYGTFYQGFYGKSAFFEGKKGIAIADITDGTANTIMAIEAPTDVPWAKPEDIPFNPDKPLPKMKSMYSSKTFNAAFGDGSVRGIALIVKEATLKAFITRNGGEVIGDD